MLPYFQITAWSTTTDVLCILAPYAQDDAQVAAIVDEINRQGRIVIGPDFRLVFLRHYHARHIHNRLRYWRGHPRPTRGIQPPGNNPG